MLLLYIAHHHEETLRIMNEQNIRKRCNNIAFNFRENYTFFKNFQKTYNIPNKGITKYDLKMMKSEITMQENWRTHLRAILVLKK